MQKTPSAALRQRRSDAASRILDDKTRDKNLHISKFFIIFAPNYKT